MAALTVCHLLRASARQFARWPGQVRQPISRHVFSRGAYWLAGWLPASEPDGGRVGHPGFGWYGGLKYGSSLLAALLVAAVLAWQHLWLLLPLSGLAFYLVEVHLLFLFPLLLDGVAHPLRRSVQATYRVGLLRALAWTLAIAAFMLTGLLDWRQPWRRWHIGCLAVLRWYDAEIRAGVQRRL